MIADIVKVICVLVWIASENADHRFIATIIYFIA